MNEIAGWLVSVTVGVVVGLAVLGFLHTRCCTRRPLLKRKKRDIRISTGPLHSLTPDAYLTSISIPPQPSMFRLNQTPHHMLPCPVPSRQETQNAEVTLPTENIEDDDSFSDDYEYINNNFEYTPYAPIPEALRSILPVRNYDVPSPLPTCIPKTSGPPINVRLQGSMSGTLKLMPPAGSEISVSHGDMTNISIHSTLSSMMPLARPAFLPAIEAGEGTSIEDEEISLRPGQAQQREQHRLTVAQMELDNKVLVSFKLNLNE